MNLSNTWQNRLKRTRVNARTGGIIALSVLSLLGGAAAWRVFVAPERPDIASIAQHVSNSTDQVGSFASDFVVGWLTATTNCQQQAAPAADLQPVDATCRDQDRAVLQRFITTPDNAAALPRTPAAVVTIPQTVSVISAGAVGEAQLYTAVVAVNERPYASAQPTRAYYQVPVSLWHYQPRAMAMPARINGPGPGADVKLSYRQALGSDSAIYAVVNGFIRNYLTATAGLDRYVLAGTPLTAVGGYQSSVVTSASAVEVVPDNPRPGTQIHVLANVVAQTSQFATVNMTYPLLVENSGGTWMIAAINLIPNIANSEPNPLGSQTSS